MKYLVGFLIGLLAGVASAAALVFFNPLTRGQTLPENDATWVLDFSLDPSENWITTHDRRLALGVKPSDVSLLWENGIRRSVLNALPLADAAHGLTAMATRISVPSPDTEFLLSGLVVDDYWLISVPGEGSLFVHAVDNLWPLVRDTVVRVGWLKQSFQGTSVYGPTQGPTQAGADVFGMSGRFAGAGGRSRERVSLDAFAEPAGFAALEGQLLIELDREGP